MRQFGFAVIAHPDVDKYYIDCADATWTEDLDEAMAITEEPYHYIEALQTWEHPEEWGFDSYSYIKHCKSKAYEVLAETGLETVRIVYFDEDEEEIDEEVYGATD